MQGNVHSATGPDPCRTKFSRLGASRLLLSTGSRHWSASAHYYIRIGRRVTKPDREDREMSPRDSCSRGIILPRPDQTLCVQCNAAKNWPAQIKHAEGTSFSVLFAGLPYRSGTSAA